jgi:hypothetical protein
MTLNGESVAIGSSGEYRDVVQEVFFSLFGRGTGSTAEYRLEVVQDAASLAYHDLCCCCRSLTKRVRHCWKRLLGSCFCWRESPSELLEELLLS